jgi:hypothetical protein
MFAVEHNTCTMPYKIYSSDRLICSPCAHEAHNRANTTFPVGLFERAIFGTCTACGVGASLLPARLFEVVAPSATARRFAVAVQATLHSIAGSGHKVYRARARYGSGWYSVRVVPRKGIAIESEPARDEAEALHRLVETVNSIV